MSSSPKAHTLLVVDDEKLFTQSLAEGLMALDPHLKVRTAENGLLAQEVLQAEEVDLVLTDLKMPVMDGFELLAYMSRSCPQVPALVMTAFGTPEIAERLHSLGIGTFIEKPVDFATLYQKIREALSSASGVVRGIPLPTFLQIIEIERKSCTLRVVSGKRTGLLQFVSGVLYDAEAGDLSGEIAAAEIVLWEGATIEILAGRHTPSRRINSTLGHLLLESFRVEDERQARVKNHKPSVSNGPGTFPAGASPLVGKEERIMSAVDKLKELGSLEGFAGAGVFTPTGEPLAVVTAGTGFSKEIGILANNVLMNAQKASLEMGAGRGQQVHIEGEKAHILARCLNEGTDPLKSLPGKAHIHTVIALSSDSSIGMAKLRLNQIVEKLAEDFRM